MASSSQASNVLKKQLKDLDRDPIDGFSAWLVDENNLFEWNLAVTGLPDTPYEKGVFYATMSFPKDYPNSPPAVRFTSDIWHPDVGPDGKVSIPILNPPGNNRYEAANCWSPADTVESIALGIMSMLSSFVGESPAKVEAAVSQKAIHNISVPRNIIACCCKDDHILVLETFAKQFTCDGCKQQGSGPRYKCKNCTYELHDECRFPKSTTYHEFFGNLEFKFFDKPQEGETGPGPDRWCDACGKRILGFNYQSVDKQRDLHPCCSKLQNKLRIEDTLFELQKELVISRCIWCEKKKVSDGVVPGWAYASRCGDYNFHVHCLMEMVHMNASIKDTNLGSLQKIDLAHLAKSKKKHKKGSKFSRFVKIVITTLLSILLGDPTALLAGALVESIFVG